jgi:type VI secretion system protein ImpF
MARVDLDQPLLPSILDRLLDANPDLSRDPPKSRGQHLAEMRQAVRRDLEALLNARQRCISWPGDLQELDRSLFSYGIRDFASINLGTKAERQAFCRELEDVIRRNEPRFVSVAVSLLENQEAVDRTLRFRIEALMYADPAPEPIVFDSFVNPAAREIMVADAGHG